MNTIADRPGGVAALLRPPPDAVAAVRMAQARIHVETISTLAALEAIGPAWDALFASAGMPQQVFQTHAWLRAWASIYVGRGVRLAILAGRIDGRLVAVWPLVVETRLGVRVLRGMGEPLSQYSDALMAPDLGAPDEAAMWDAVMAQRADIVVLRRVRDDAACAPLLRRKLGGGRDRQEAPFVELADTTDAAAFAARFSGKQRADRRRRRRRLEDQGALRVLHHGPSPEAAGLVPVALGFKRDWARAAGTVAPTLFDPRFERFFFAAAQDVSEAASLRVTVLTCGAEIAGVGLSVACRGRLFGHVLAPNPAFRAFGIGGLLAEAIIAGAIAAGDDGVDLLAPADAYKLDWTERTGGVGDYWMPRTLRGRLYARLWLDGGRGAAKRLGRRLGRMAVKLRPLWGGRKNVS